jgi:dTDP-4-amino-4,6-dideoxygalactose transaminase
VLSFNGNKKIITSGVGALICTDAESKNIIMWYATQARESYPYYQYEKIGYNYRMSNICAGIGIESRPLWKPMHLQPVYADVPRYVNGVFESLFKKGLCLPSGPYVTEEDVKYIVEQIKKNME